MQQWSLYSSFVITTGVILTSIGAEDRIFVSSSAKDPEAKGATPNSAS